MTLRSETTMGCFRARLPLTWISLVVKRAATTILLVAMTATVVNGLSATVGPPSLRSFARVRPERMPSHNTEPPNMSGGDDPSVSGRHGDECDTNSAKATAASSCPDRFLIGRRESMDVCLRGGLLGLCGAGLSWTAPHDASAAETAASSSTTATSRAVLSRLAGIPTFCIVDGATGVPYMIFDGQASATGYFFLSFRVASEALNDAREKDAKGRAIWEAAQIVVVPLPVALQLALTRRQRVAVNGGGAAEGVQFKTFADTVPSEEGVEDAKSRANTFGQNSEKWSQKGRVPLFYVEGLALPPSSKESAGMEPRYFNAADLEREWRAQHPGSDGSTIPPVQVVEFVDLFRTAVAKNDWSTLANVAIMPVQESNQVAVELMKKQKASASAAVSYNFDKVFLVGSSKS